VNLGTTPICGAPTNSGRVLPDQDKHLQDMLKREFGDFIAILNAQAQVTTF